MSNQEIMFSLLIIIAVGLAAWLSRREGQRNPVGTANLQSDVTKLTLKVTRIEAKLDEVKKDVDTGPTAAQIATLFERIDGFANLVNSTDQAVIRIEAFLMKRGS